VRLQCARTRLQTARTVYRRFDHDHAPARPVRCVGFAARTHRTAHRMNFYSATLIRLGQRFRRPRIIEKRTYVFILVPFHVRGNGYAKEAMIVDPILDASEPRNERAARPAAAIKTIPTDDDGVNLMKRARLSAGMDIVPAEPALATQKSQMKTIIQSLLVYVSTLASAKCRRGNYSNNQKQESASHHGAGRL